jgi:hypothetical protein
LTGNDEQGLDRASRESDGHVNYMYRPAHTAAVAVTEVVVMALVAVGRYGAE